MKKFLLKNKIFGLSSISLSLFRISLGLTLVGDLIFNKILIRSTLYNYENGLYGSIFLNSILFKESFFGFITSNYEFPYILYFALFVYVIYILGIYNNLAKFLTLFIFIYLSHKNFLLMIGADQIITCLLIFTLFLPLDRHYTVNCKREVENIEVRNIFVIGLLLQIGLIYFFNAINKTGDTWINGSAISYVLNDSNIQTIFSHLLVKYSGFCTSLTYMTLVYEFLFLFLLFSPLKNQKIRIILAFLMISFHMGISVFIKIGYFNFVYLSIGIMLLPNSFWTFFDFRTNEVNRENAKMNPILRIIGFILIFIIVQRNVYTYCKRLYMFDNGIGQRMLRPLDGLNTLPNNTPFIMQRWVYFSPNPPLENGYVTIELNLLDSNIVLYSSSTLSHYGLANDQNQIINLLNLRFRHFMYKKYINCESKYYDDILINDFERIWKQFYRSRIDNYVGITRNNQYNVFFNSANKIKPYSIDKKYLFSL